MTRTWPTLGQRANVTTQLVGEAALALLLGVTLALCWSDGTPSHDPYAILPTLSGIPSMQASMQDSAQDSGDNLHLVNPFRVSEPPVVTPALLPQAPIPSAPPVRLLLPTLNLHPPVESVGLDRNGAMDTPENIWDVGWYKAGPVPGAPGDAVIDGHAGYPGQPLIFGRLVKIQPGASIVVLLADGSKQVFTVVSVQSLPVNSMPQDMFEPYGPPRLTLITCDGQFNSDNKTYANRLVVEASYAGIAP
jgi:hypothetical protein